MEASSSRRRLAVLAALVAGLGVWAAVVTPRGAPGPVMTWLCDGRDLPGDLVELTQEDPLVLQLDLDGPAYVYVAWYAPSLGTLALFPSEQLRTDLPNRLAAGRHRLPGTTEEIEGSWPALWPARSLCAMVVVSREPRRDLETMFATFRQVGNAAFRDRSMGLYAPKRGMASVPPKGTLPSGLLRQAYDLPASGALVPAGDGVWIGAMRATLAEKSGFERNPLQELQKKAPLPPK